MIIILKQSIILCRIQEHLQDKAQKIKPFVTSNSEPGLHISAFGGNFVGRVWEAWQISANSKSF